jgi:4-diphosphocytidyl-2-C-methyl-D-erythritol kinase
MGHIELNANAKINLSLDVTGKRPDGYHTVKMIMQSVDLHDRVRLEIIDSGIQVKCNFPWIPTDRNNTAYRAAELIKENFGIKEGIKISIEKNIPVAAGLAGGSTDGAAVLKGMNSLFSLNISETDLMSYGEKIGADVPYCIKGGTMLAEGIGEILTELTQLERTSIVIVKPKISVSTAWAYKNLDVENIKIRPDTDLLIKALDKKNIVELANNMVNIMETITIKQYHIIDEIKKKLINLGAVGSMMSGSGPSVFGIFLNEDSAEKAYRKIKSNRWESFLTHTV